MRRPRLKRLVGLSACVLSIAASHPASAGAQTPATEATEPVPETAADAGEPEEVSALPVAYLTLGAGATQRTIHFNAFDGAHALATGLVPALELSLRAGVEHVWSCYVEVTYRSSVFATAIQTPVLQDAPAQRTTLQTHEVIGGIEPGVHFGGPAGPAVALFAGYGARALGSVIKLSSIPRFTLHGPLLRLILELPWQPAGLVLRVGPELHWIVSQTSELRELASTQRWGLSYGVEASLALRLFSALSLRLSYREARARIASGWQTPFTDTARYVLVEALVRYF